MLEGLLAWRDSLDQGLDTKRGKNVGDVDVCVQEKHTGTEKQEIAACYLSPGGLTWRIRNISEYHYLSINGT